MMCMSWNCHCGKGEELEFVTENRKIKLVLKEWRTPRPAWLSHSQLAKATGEKCLFNIFQHLRLHVFNSQKAITKSPWERASWRWIVSGLWPSWKYACRVSPEHKRWKVYIPNDKNSTSTPVRPSADVRNARLPFTSTTAFHVCLCRSVFSVFSHLFKAGPPLSC